MNRYDDSEMLLDEARRRANVVMPMQGVVHITQTEDLFEYDCPILALTHTDLGGWDFVVYDPIDGGHGPTLLDDLKQAEGATAKYEVQLSGGAR